jgi:hypothetical protein
MLSWPESMHRGSSRDQVQNVSRCMRGAHPVIQASSFAGASQDDICEKYEDMIVDILYCCSRPFKGLLQTAAEKAYADFLSKDECLQLAERLMAAISSCREKAKSMTTGKKLPDCVKNICTVLRKVSDSDLAASLVEKEKRLKAVSSPSTFAGRLKRKASEALRKHPSETPLPEPLKGPAVSSSSKKNVSLQDELNQLRASYGLTSQPSELIMDIQSSQEEIASLPAASAGFIEYMTPTSMVRLHKDGRKESGKLVPGKNGFAVAVFGKETVNTEVPNLLVTLPIIKRPASKRPASALVPPNDQPSDSEASESPVTAAEDPPDPSGMLPLVSLYGDKALQVAKPKPFEFPNGDIMYFTDATDQSYICVLKHGLKKKTLVVALTRVQATKHMIDFRKAILEIWSKLIEKGSCCKASALKYRQDILEATL